MSYHLIKDLISLVEVYNQENVQLDSSNLNTFIEWLKQRDQTETSTLSEPYWKGKENGRSADSVINTSIVHLYRYAKQHAKDAISGSDFTTADDFFYLISLVSNGDMTKTALIKNNVHEKSVGIQIINRLIAGGFVSQSITENDKRNRMIHITEKGRLALEDHLQQMRKASQRVTEPLNYVEKLELVKLLLKLEDFHEQNSTK